MAPEIQPEIQAELQTLRTQFAAELAKRDEQIDLLRERLQLQTEQVSLLREAAATVSSKRAPRARLPDPDKFDGQQIHWDTWLPAIEAKLLVDGEAIGNSVSQFYYVYGRLESSTQATVLPQLHQARLTKQWNHQSLLDQLSRLFNNPNKVKDAKRQLHELKQGGRSFLSFLATFERILHEAQGYSWDDDRKVSALRPCLSDSLQRKLHDHDAFDVPNTYVDFVRLLQKLSGRPTTSSAFAPSSLSAPVSSGRPPAHSFSRPADKMDISTIEPNPELVALEVAPPPQRRTLYNPSPSRSPAHSRSSSAHSQCYRCGANDHFIGYCPHPPQNAGKKVTTIDKAYWEEQDRIRDQG